MLKIRKRDIVLKLLRITYFVIEFIEQRISLSQRKLMKLYRLLNSRYIIRSQGRIFLEEYLMPYFKNKKYKNILIVGVDLYTLHYPYFLSNNKNQIVSIDCDKSKAKYGAVIHLIDKVQNITKFINKETFDFILFNGVYGWGLDNLNEVEECIKGFRYILSTGGIVLFGYNETKDRDPLILKKLNLWSKYGFIPESVMGNSRYEIDENNQIFEIWKKI